MNELPHVCLVTSGYPPDVGGVQHSTYRVAGLLVRAGFRVDVVVFQRHPVSLPLDECVTTTTEDGVVVHRAKLQHPGRGEVASLEQSTHRHREMFQLLDGLQRRNGYELLHAFFLQPAAFITSLVGRLHGVKTIASIRGNDVGRNVFDPARMSLTRISLENADYVTSVSTSLLELASRAFTPLEGKSKVILNSVDLSTLQPREWPALSLKGTVIGSLGLFRYKKGLRYLFKALEKIKSRFEFTLLLAGEFSTVRGREEHLGWLEECGLRERTIITGLIPRDRVADYLQQIDIAVFPSLFAEGCPLALLEAMALQRPIVASRSSAIPEVLDDRVSGLLVEPASSADLAAALTELLEKPQLRRDLGQGAGEAARRLAPERELAEWMEVYDAVRALP